MKAYLAISDVAYAEDVSMNVKFIKQYVKSSSYYYIINLLMGIRNALGHDCMTSVITNNIVDLITDSVFESFLEKMQFPSEIVAIFTTTDSLKFNSYISESKELTPVGSFC